MLKSRIFAFATALLLLVSSSRTMSAFDLQKLPKLTQKLMILNHNLSIHKGLIVASALFTGTLLTPAAIEFYRDFRQDGAPHIVAAPITITTIGAIALSLTALLSGVGFSLLGVPILTASN